jgi:hypothetical protein
VWSSTDDGREDAWSCDTQEQAFSLEDHAADDFRDLGDDGVAEGFKAVHSAGNPMSHSGDSIFPSVGPRIQ